MEQVFEELGILPKYLKKSANDDRYIALVHKQWLKYVWVFFLSKKKNVCVSFKEESGISDLLLICNCNK